MTWFSLLIDLVLIDIICEICPQLIIAIVNSNFLEQAFWIGDVFVPEHYTQAVSCDESEQ